MIQEISSEASASSTSLDVTPHPRVLVEIMQERSIVVDSQDREIIERAFDYAKQAHDGQMRSSGEPYFNHVFATAMNCASFGMDTTTVVAGLLHDTIEDTPTTRNDIEQAFGHDVAFLVEGVTKLGKVQYKGEQRHAESLRKFFVASSRDVRVVIIKLADRLHNLQTLEFVRKDKQKRIALESIEIHSALASRLGMGKLAGKIQDLAFPFAYPSEYALMSKALKQRRKTDAEFLDKAKKALLRILAEKDFHDFEIQYRLKGLYSLYKKVWRKEGNLDNVYDIIALRVIVDSLEECYRLLGVIHSVYKPLPNRIKDFIALPKMNGYQSLHTTIFTGDGGIVEIQIRTHQMHDVAEYGIASHHSYKFSQSKKKKNAKESFNWIQDLQELESRELAHADIIKHLKTDFFQDRIFVFTPKGDVIDLPVGATVVDFAYAIHSDMGNHLAGASVNGKNVALRTELKNEDIVHIEQNKKAVPTRKWLDYAKTSMAQRFIRNHPNVKNGGILGWFKSE